MKPSIHLTGDHPTLRFAARELSRHLQLATRRPAPIISHADQAAFRLGLARDLGIDPPRGLAADDDWVVIQPRRGGYVLGGSNPRSVLFAVYRYLRHVGFRWIRPGARGQIVPRLRRALVTGLRVEERPSYPFRTVCIEGACSVQHVLDMIDWMAKHGMNGYFIQFHLGTHFFKRWYQHRGSTVLKPESFSQAELERGVGSIVESLNLRGMNFERMGHGWTCAALGIDGEQGWDKTDKPGIAPHRVDWLAQVNGKKELWGGVALNTNLNYGNPAVREAMTEAIVAYAGKHPEVNLLHFWLADGMNNHDERPESAAARPSDFFVDMLNLLDAKLTAAGLATRIVFLVYVDLLWAPLKARLKNPDRFVLMFAPITRTYLRSFTDPDKSDEKKTPYVRNKLTMPKSARVNIEYLRDWQKQFRGRGFDFDYHMIWACYYDPNMFTMARTLHRDIQGLSKIGLHGVNSCQVQRMSFPHNLLMDVMARTLWDKRASFDAIVRETFRDQFGAAGPKVAVLMDRLSRCWLPFFEATYIPDADRKRIDAGLRRLPMLRALTEELADLVKMNKRRAKGAVKWSWDYLGVHARLLELLVPAFEAYLRAEPDMRGKLNRAIDYLWKVEPKVHPALDCYMIVGVLQWRANELEEWLKKQVSQ